MVALTEEKPEEDCRQMSVVFGDHVRPAAARRSEILTHHESTDIISELPGRLSPDEIRLWQAACLLECEPSTSELVTILKVASNVSGASVIMSVPDSRWQATDAIVSSATPFVFRGAGLVNWLPRTLQPRDRYIPDYRMHHCVRQCFHRQLTSEFASKTTDRMQLGAAVLH